MNIGNSPQQIHHNTITPLSKNGLEGFFSLYFSNEFSKSQKERDPNYNAFLS
jgi:hypothetical protein